MFQNRCVEQKTWKILVVEGFINNYTLLVSTGDTNRVNEHPNLGVTHTVFLREHNRLAAELVGRLDPTWDDERLYQEARRILTAQMQHITFNEWLPIVIGRVKMRELGQLLPLEKGWKKGKRSGLRQKCKSFHFEWICWSRFPLRPHPHSRETPVRFVFLHLFITLKSLINRFCVCSLTSKLRIKEREILLRQHFFKTQEIYTPGNLDKFLVGLASQPSQKAEHYFTQEVLILLQFQ